VIALPGPALFQSRAPQDLAYIDAIGKLDGTGCLLEWKTTSSRYPEEPHKGVTGSFTL